MTDISNISGSQRLTSQPKVSLESARQTPSALDANGESQEMEKLSSEMEHVQQAFVLIKEIRVALETALRDLSAN